MQKFINKKFGPTRYGEILIIFQAVLWGVFPIITKASLTSLPTLIVAGLSMLISAFFFAAVLTLKKSWAELKIAQAWRPIINVSLINGCIFYGLVFFGMNYTSSNNASIILQMEIFFTIVILKIWQKKRTATNEVIGSVLMIFGVIFILFPGKISLNLGDLMILIATTVPVFGNHYTMEARKQVSSHTILFIRSSFCGISYLAIAYLLDYKFDQNLIQNQLPSLLINGIVLFGFSKILWIESLLYISLPKALSLSAISPAFTLIFAFFLNDEMPSLWQVIGFLPIFWGVRFLTKVAKGAPI